jgi:hypothetical protein
MCQFMAEGPAYESDYGGDLFSIARDEVSAFWN